MEAPTKTQTQTTREEREFLINALLQAADRENRRIGRELHDHLCQVLLGASFAAKALGLSLPPGSPALAELNDLVRLINSAAQETRDIARRLSSAELDSPDLATTLRQLIARPYGGFSCRLECAAPVLLSDARTARHIYRIAEEAVANAVQHSGGTEIVIRLGADEEHLHLQVADNGRGFPPRRGANGGLGLAMMKYRAEALNARLRFDTLDEGGANVTCTLPKRT